MSFNYAPEVSMKRFILAIALLLSLNPYTTRAEDLARYANDLLQSRYAADAPGGALLVARGDKVLFRAARGHADVDKNVPLRADSVFRIGSMTKQFAAAGLLQLVDAGRVKLEDPLSKYVPEYPGGDRITVLQLLNHTAGVRNYTAIPGYMNEPVRRDLTTAQMIDVFKNEKPVFEPGSKWDYSNSGYILVGALIEAASGKPWHEYLRQALFAPLGMKNTGYAGDAKLAARVVNGHTYQGNKLLPARMMSMTQAHAAGGLVSNVDDLLKWTRALHEARVLKNGTYAKMITPVGPAADPVIGCGFGVFSEPVRKSRALSHGGRIFGFMSSLTYLPGPDITVVVLENDDQDNDRIGGDSADNVARRLAAVALGDPYPALRAVKIDAAKLNEAEAVYQFEGGVTRVLRVVDEKLTAQRDGQGPRIVLTPIAPDDFLYADGFNRIQLERDASGTIRGARYFAGGNDDGVTGARSAEPLPPLPVWMKLPRTTLERLVGTYAFDRYTLKVSLDGEALMAQMSGQPPAVLGAKSATEFVIEETGGSIVFSAGDTPAAEAMFRLGGREMLLKRVP